MKLKEKRLKIGNITLKLTPKIQFIMLCIILLICTIVGIALNNQNAKPANFQNINIQTDNINTSPTFSKNTQEATTTPVYQEEILVHVSGAVQKPGLVCVPLNSRVNDAIKAAGGILPNADLKSINLADFIYDGTKLHIPLLGESLAPIISTTKPNKEIQDANSSLVKTNINTASADELTKLSGIGIATAENIISYRNKNGNFKSIEDILNVKGIGKSKYNNIKNNICV